MTCPGSRLDGEAAVLPSRISGISTTEAVEREVRDLRILAEVLRREHSLTERTSIRDRVRLTQTLMLYVTEVADTSHASWRELGNLTHKILVETSDVERYRKWEFRR